MKKNFTTHILLVLIFLGWITGIPQKISANDQPEPEFYTVQVASYLAYEDAEHLFNMLTNWLPAPMKKDLRIEKVSSFYTVRVGKSKEQKTILPLLEECAKFTPAPSLISAFYIKKRIRKIYTPKDNAEEIPPVYSSEPPAEEDIPDPRVSLPPYELAQPEQIVPFEEAGPSIPQKIPRAIAQDDTNQYYTLQLATYLMMEDAELFYELLASKLPAHLSRFLRIEKISSFFAIRIGREETRDALLPILNECKKFAPTPAIIRAYYRLSRIRKALPVPDREEEQQEIAAATPQKQPQQITMAEQAPVPPVETTLIPTETAGQETPPASVFVKENEIEAQVTPPDETAAAAHQPLEVAPPLTPAPVQPPQPQMLAKSPKPASEQQKPATPFTTKLGEHFQESLIAKYLQSDSQKTDTKKTHARERSATFAQNPDCTSSSCHAALAPAAHTHEPVQTTRCLACHVQQSQKHPSESQPSSDDFRLSQQDASLCEICHIADNNKKTVHEPVQNGQCLTCHSPHGSGNPALLTVNEQNLQELCKECHDSKAFQYSYQHGPVGLGACNYCHDPHSSDLKVLLRDDPQTLCQSCHSDFIKGMKESPYTHTVVKEQSCLACHAAHGSDFPNLLSTTGEKFCFSCHTDIEEKISKARTKHAGLYLGKQCGTCHQAHFSDYKALLIKQEKDLCLTCHTADTPMKSYAPYDMESELADKEFLHTPVAKGECSGCHNPHGSNYGNLLTDEYPTSFYAPLTPTRYQLCFNCHDKTLLNESATNESTLFRNGSTNLHLTHVGIERKGRTCNACHKSHASDGPKLISNKGAIFGTWEMSLDFYLTKTGGTCTPGCHREMSYDRQTPHDNSQEEFEFGKYFIDYESKK